jgi:hypothetical protein
LLVTPHRLLRCHHCGDSLRMACTLSRLTYCGQIIVIILMVTFNPGSKDVHTASYYITLSTSNRLTLLHSPPYTLELVPELRHDHSLLLPYATAPRLGSRTTVALVTTPHAMDSCMGHCSPLHAMPYAWLSLLRCWRCLAPSSNYLLPLSGGCLVSC